MAKTKQPYQEQIDNLCKDLGITETQYNDKTTIPELEAIIDKLEAQLPDEEDQEPETDPEQSEASQDAPLNNDEVEITLTDEAACDIATTVEANSDYEGQFMIEVRAVSTFRCRVGDERITVIAGNRKFLPEDVAMDALQNGVAVTGAVE
ncbi:hypothetical protein HC752_21375 [Vibrio sp. S9_S30]|uniref:hypothetical protein n=1 Tax=Vibrio sp. S9_S30 TaxID=2720226 RepID=UPI0016806FFC|nr:hypothetical protein [Vibrio sp. S9_S30]MBD1559497.1 hypothetical protein [Vibrio sp. S9_S30]